MIEALSGVAAATLDSFRACGRGQRECVAYWIGGWSEQRVEAVVHPVHLADAHGYEVDGPWVNAFLVGLAARRQRVLAQVHSHPGSWVEMSRTDDRFVISPSAGFVSIIVPHFGERDGRMGWGTWKLEAGRWVDGTGDVRWIRD